MRFFLSPRQDTLNHHAVFILLMVFILGMKCDQCELNRVSDNCYVDRHEQKLDQVDKMENGNSLAVVLYREENVLPLHKRQRTFTFCKHNIEINQDWSGLGVAAVVWDAAEVLSAYLESNPQLVKGKSVIELGAGTGLVGIVAALLGAKTTITDRLEVMDYLRETVQMNLPTEYLKDTIIAPLDWTKDLDSFNHDYDVILGADIVYIEEVFDDLLKTLTTLSSKKTVIYLSCRIRYNRDTNFLNKLEETFTVTKLLYDQGKDVNLYLVVQR